MNVIEFKKTVDLMQAQQASKTYRLDLKHAEDGSIEVTRVKRLDSSKPSTEHVATWTPVDKRGFVRGFLNNVEKFITK
jgi:hypothetical protein